jgi:hypothetical protein
MLGLGLLIMPPSGALTVATLPAPVEPADAVSLIISFIFI